MGSGDVDNSFFTSPNFGGIAFEVSQGVSVLPFDPTVDTLRVSYGFLVGVSVVTVRATSCDFDFSIVLLSSGFSDTNVRVCCACTRGTAVGTGDVRLC
jgi:hypothetical protein